MKKCPLSLMLILSLLIALGSAGRGVPLHAEEEPKEIVFWHSMAEDTGQALEKLVDAFNEGPGGAKGLRVESVFQGSYSDATSKLRTVLQSGQSSELPDVMQFDATGIVSYRGADEAYPVERAMEDYPGFELAHLLEVPLAYWNYSGVQLGLPFSSSTTVTYYNKTLLDSVGFTEAPDTFAGIIALAEALPEENTAGEPLYAFAGVPNTPLLANWIGQIPGEGVNSSYVLDQENGRAGTASRVIAAEEGTLQTFLTAWKDMYEAGALLNEPSDLTDLFVAERIAMFTASSSGLGRLPKLIDGAFEMGVSGFPRINEACETGATVSGSGIFMFDRAEGMNTEAAWDFMQFLVSPESQAEFSMASGYIPAHKDSYELASFKAYTEKQPEILTVVQQVEETDTAMKGIVVGPSWDVYMEIQDQCFLMLEDDVPVDEAADLLVETLDDLLRTYEEANPED